MKTRHPTTRHQRMDPTHCNSVTAVSRCCTLDTLHLATFVQMYGTEYTCMWVGRQLQVIPRTDPHILLHTHTHTPFSLSPSFSLSIVLFLSNSVSQLAAARHTQKISTYSVPHIQLCVLPLRNSAIVQNLHLF